MPAAKTSKKSVPLKKKAKAKKSKNTRKPLVNVKAPLKTKRPKKKIIKKIKKKSLPKKSRKKVEKKPDKRFSIPAYLFITLGIIFTIIPLIFYFNQTIQLALFNPKTTEIKHIKRTSPTEISIPSIKLTLKTRPTIISNNIWQIAEDGASYLSTSARPGEKGAIIMYGHNTPERFGPILDLTPGKTIILKTSDQKPHVYKIAKTLEVYPDKMDVFNQRDETLVIYTCAGFADLKRFIVIAKPII